MGAPTEIENLKPPGLGVRHLQTFLMFLAMLLAFSMRVNMSMAIVDMIRKDNPEIRGLGAEHVPVSNMSADSFAVSRRLDQFDWTMKEQSYILSSFFWGYVILQVPGGELAKKVGGKIMILISIAVNSLVSVAIPFAALLGGWPLVCVCRFLQGLTQAFVYPCTHHLISQWIPAAEKGSLSTIIYAGGQLGISLQLIVAGYLAATFGWQAIFFANGIVGAIWCIAYVKFGSPSPERSTIISEKELLYIQRSLGRVGEQKRYRTPWFKILTSLPFWAVIIAHCGQNWGYFTLMTEMPTYMTNILGTDLKNSGALSCLPYLAMYALSIPMGFLTDVMVRKKWMSVTNCRKLFNSIGLWGPCITLIGLSYVPPGNVALAVTMLTISVGINSGIFSGFMLVHIDQAPNFSSSLMGITNLLSNIVSIIAPLVCGAIVRNESDPSDWRIVFFLASGIYFLSNLFFISFVSSDRQPWNEPREERRVFEMKPPEKTDQQAKV